MEEHDLVSELASGSFVDPNSIRSNTEKKQKLVGSLPIVKNDEVSSNRDGLQSDRNNKSLARGKKRKTIILVQDVEDDEGMEKQNDKEPKKGKTTNKR